jgi:NAD(P)-dependent dehydrogenase (short-subunit alcohol dehydrogenase family)
LDGKVAIVTGAGRGIGRGIALAFAKEGARVVIAEINSETAKASEESINEFGGAALAVTCDVGDPADVIRMVDAAVAAFGPVDVLVNTAQGFITDRPAEEIDEDGWDYSFRTGPAATFHCCKAVFPYMKERGGKIVNFGSRAGIVGVPEQTNAAYAAAKEAIRGFSRQIAREWGKYNINVNVICPSAASELSVEWGKRNPDLAEKALSEKSIRRWGHPENDVGRVAVFLASNDSDYVTGQTVMVDGGHHMV